MILHVTFTDGSNPWVCFSDDRKELADHWKDWVKHHPWEAVPQAYCGDYICKTADDRAGYCVYKQGEFWDTVKQYKYLGHALAALKKKGGGNS
jgi:hypothetical protein